MKKVLISILALATLAGCTKDDPVRTAFPTTVGKPRHLEAPENKPKEELIISKSQLYKMAGNSIVVNPMFLVFERLLYPVKKTYNLGDQMSLFKMML